MTSNEYDEHIAYQRKRFGITESIRQMLVELASGLQAVDGLETSAVYDHYADAYIKGDISSFDFANAVELYYLDKENRANEEANYEANLVGSRLVDFLDTASFSMTPSMLQTIHAALFKGLMEDGPRYEYGFRDYDFIKHERVLAGESVEYETYSLIEFSLANSFRQQQALDLFSLNSEQQLNAVADFIADVWKVHAFAEGNTRTTAVFTILYLRSLGYSDITNDLFAAYSAIFRDSLVRANYSNIRFGIKEDRSYLHKFIDVVINGGELDFRDRDLYCNDLYMALNLELPSKQFADHEQERQVPPVPEGMSDILTGNQTPKRLIRCFRV